MMIDTLGVIFNDFNNASMGLLIVAAVTFAISYAISAFFKWAVFRIIILLISFSILSQVLQQKVILFDLDLYIALGMAAPHLKFAHILAYRIWYALVGYYYKIRRSFIALYEFFLRLYRAYLSAKAYFGEKKSRWEQRKNSRSQSRQEEFKHSYQKQEQRQEYRESRREERSRYQEQKSYEHKDESTSRWDSNDPYLILDIARTATAQEIKRQYRKLQKIYHPDLTQSHIEEYTHIAQRLNYAYEKLKGIQ